MVHAERLKLRVHDEEQTDRQGLTPCWFNVGKTSVLFYSLELICGFKGFIVNMLPVFQWADAALQQKTINIQAAGVKRPQDPAS